MARGYACFHHCNDLDRPSVAQCNVCGKALCAECVKVLRSKKTGKMLCVECRNQEIQKDENLAAQISIRLKQEMKRMIIAFIIGVAISVVLGITGIAPTIVSILLPFFVASFGVINGKAKKAKMGCIGAIFVLIWQTIISPITLVKTFIARKKQRELMHASMAQCEQLKAANIEFFRLARKKTSGITSSNIENLLAKMKTANQSLGLVSQQLASAQSKLALAEVTGNNEEITKLKGEIKALQAQQSATIAQQAKLREEMNTNEAKHDKETAEINQRMTDLINEQEDLTSAMNMALGN